MDCERETISSLIDYNPKTGEFTWKTRCGEFFSSNGSCAAWNTRWSGKRAGAVQKPGQYGYARRIVYVLGKPYKEHRLAWLLMTGEWPKDEIDHINRDATDNRWCNLRLCDHSSNGRNLSMKNNNTSGTTGVSWSKIKRKWRARVKLNYRENFLGYYDNKEDAAKAVNAFYEDNGFDPEHGVERANYYNIEPLA